MPANEKYLSSSGQRFLKITAGILGGFFVTIFFHNALGTIMEEKGGLIITSAYTSFLLWALLMVMAFLAKNGWKVWGIYLLLSIVFCAVIFLNK
ncbi:hypothetical protein V1387_14735 [Allomuricauda taeanensis]|uniref:hypothetical protein n=1 Tax=Flagellimonas taeanensis TaxID=1005926 RepID=UPI002E7B21C7|nr:hypothetical protein [Allomuricauda taeanensis]MEE1963947.1 hypothetical protein [Allomuricauda taeanensis]